MIENATLIARMPELLRLEQFLNSALEGQGGVRFVAGNAGTGKTLLTRHFEARTLAQHPNVLVVRGMCDAQSGFGDAYAPFRDALTMLLGSIEDQIDQDNASAENRRRLNQALDFTLAALLDHAPDLIGTIIPWGKLPAKFAVDLAKDNRWLANIKRNSRKTTLSDIVGSDSLDQGQLYEQCVNMLCRVAKRQPLVIVFDDLHWADPASIGLLFRLGRRLEGQRVLVIGTYRPEELPLSGAQRHPLLKTIYEFERYYGDVSIDLDRCVQERGRQFIETLLAAQPNQFDEAFANVLLEKTRGHPMFTVELLQALAASGHIFKSADGVWQAKSNIHWHALPSRIEGIVKERMAHLNDDQRHILSIGAVEGEQFSAETIARITQRRTRDLVAELSGTLQDEHQIVAGVGIKRVNGLRLPYYRFSQHLFRTYLYAELDSVEQPYLHEDVAIQLEAIYGDDAHQIASQLAHHFEKAELPERAQSYWRMAGEQAANAYANEEALGHFERALGLLAPLDAANRVPLLLACEAVQQRLANRDAQRELLDELALLVDESAELQVRARVLLRRSAYELALGSYARAFELAERATNLASEANDQALEAAAYHRCGRTLWQQGKHADAGVYIELGLELARAAAEKTTVAACLYDLAVLDYYQRDFVAALAKQRQAHAAYESAGDRSGVLRCVNLAGIIALAQGDYAVAVAELDATLAGAQQLGWRLQEARIRHQLGIAQTALGMYDAAAANCRLGVAISAETQNEADAAALHDALGLIAYFSADQALARAEIERALAKHQSLDNRYAVGFTLTHLGLVELAAGAPAAARTALTEALAIRRPQGNDAAVAEAEVLLGSAEMALGNTAAAQTAASSAFAHFTNGNLAGVEWPLLTLWQLYQLLCALDRQDAAATILSHARQLLQSQANRIADEQARTRFLARVPYNQAILNA